MMKAAPNLSTISLAAGEPFLLETQMMDTAGTVPDMTGRSYVLSFYRDDRSTVKAITGDLLSDDAGHFYRFARDGSLSEELIGQRLTVELAERLRNGRYVITSGTLTIGASAAGVPSLDTAVVGRVMTRITIRDAAALGDDPVFALTRLPYNPGGGSLAPRWSILPSLTDDGTPQVGEAIGGNDGTIINGAATGRRFLLNGAPIAGATGASYTPVASDAGKALALEVTATGPGGTHSEVSTAILIAAASGPPAADFIMQQIGDTYRNYQRSSATGGAGKGAGSIPVAITVNAPGSIFARIRAASDGAILQAPFALPDVVEVGPQIKSVGDISARLGWFFVDLASSASGPWQLGTTRVGMGGLTLLSGQSLATRSINISDDPYLPIATAAGYPVTPYGSLFHCAINNTGDEYTRPVWDVMVDERTARYNSATAAEYLRLKIAQEGVNWSIIGFSRGGSSAANWIPGGRDNAGLRANARDAGGFEEAIWYQGQGEGGQPMSVIKSRLAAIFGDLTANNVVKGAAYRKIVGGVANNVEASFAVENMLTVRASQVSWAAENSAFYVNCQDLDLLDTVHQSQKGAVTLGRHFYRAGTPESDAGPVIVSGTRAAGSGAIKLSVTLPTGATALVAKGSPAARFSVFPKGALTGKLPLAASSPLTIAGTEITLNLASVPADATALDVYAYLTLDTKTGDIDNIYDNNLDADGLTVGRQLMASIAPVAIAAPGTPATPEPPAAAFQARNLTPNGVTYGAGPTAFSQVRTGGCAISAETSRDADIIPPTQTWTVEAWITPTGGSTMAFQAEGKTYIGVSQAGTLVVQYATADGGEAYVNDTRFNGGGAMPSIVNTGRRHVAVVADPSGVVVFLDGVPVGDKSEADPKNGGPAAPPVVGAFNSENVFSFAGQLDEFVIWPIAKYAGAFQLRSTPYAGAEGMRCLYHFDGNTNAAVTP